jgi:hypothetical protein
VELFTYKGDFTKIAPSIASAIPTRAFSFIFVDPKGFSLDLQALRSLIGRDCCEVVFNFMFDFINRFALFDDPTIAPMLDRLIPSEDWRAPLRALETDSSATPEKRKRVIVDAFSQAVSKVGGYKYVADVDVRRTDSDRTLYFLIYGTRQPSGIKVFRDCQTRALGVQSELLAKKKVADRSAASNQFELLGSMNQMAPDRNQAFLKDEMSNARRLLLDIVPRSAPGEPWERIWPKVLAKHVIRLTDVNKIANECRKEGQIIFPTWTAGRKTVPDSNYMVFRGTVE